MGNNRTKKIFVLSDIHGCANELKLLINKLPLEDNSQIIFLGDYVDRGQDSKEVIEVILKLQQDYDVVALKGNHEDMFISFLEEPGSEKAGTFIYNGGGATLASYGDEYGATHIPDKHIEFLASLPYYYETDDYFFVHAGVPDLPLSEIKSGQHNEQLLWIREQFLTSGYDWEKVIVHGHTPCEEVELLDRRINIDTGCVFNNKLTALQLPEQKIYSVSINKKITQAVLKDKTSKRRSVRFEGSIPIYIFINKTMHEFETLNYSVFGMYIRDIINTDQQILKVGQKIKGEIGRHNQDTMKFEGRVVRCDETDSSFYYGIDMTKTPYDFLANPWGK